MSLTLANPHGTMESKHAVGFGVCSLYVRMIELQYDCNIYHSLKCTQTFILMKLILTSF